ncbi:MAG: 1-(5-phosphoribosyl)-5-[(5-phosphoribosylamino)methylideneamino]imidazole-4-carboxamide isomerase [Dehalococcoidia bacterium]|jgi:phosphoribosylformimino-5-aminoimidazole carboxamide ribotide isomerase
MELIPAIDIRDGHCVRLYQGDYSRETVFSDDPTAVALRWQEQGASRLHLIDLDGARAGEPVNIEVVEAIARAVTIPCQVGGGIRTLATVASYVAMGIERVILGTVAVRAQTLVAEACYRYPGAIIVAVDARDGRAAISGWLERSEQRDDELMARLVEVGVPRFIYTDIARDGTMKGPNLAALARVVRAVRVPVVASGGIASLDHLRRLAKTHVEGAILGRALYDGALSLPDALRAVA